MGKRVLLVDDNVTLAESIGDLLKMEGFSVTISHSGPQAFRVLDETVVDLIVTDLRMPEMDGLEITRRIRKSKDAKLLPVIILTADTDKANEAQVYEAGANLLIHKPFDEDHFLECIAQIISRDDE